MHHYTDRVERALEEALISVELELTGMTPAAFASMPSSETMA
jgi:hypothetical protein